MDPEKSTCVACDRGEAVVPLLRLSFRGGEFRICPQHLPILIHDPARLIGLLPGAEGLAPAEHHD